MKEQDFEQLMLFPADFPANRTALSGKKCRKRRKAFVAGIYSGCARAKPQYVVGENVNGILSTIHKCVCADLEKSNYEVWTFCIPACAVGAHHERYRVCILGISKGKAKTTNQFGCKLQKNTAGKHGQTLCASIGIIYPEHIGRYINPQFVEWLMGFPIGWGI